MATNDNPLLSGEAIYKLIPQRPPIVMVDTLVSATESEAHTALTVESDNIFCADGRLREPGLIEHIAQSAAAFAGFSTFQQGLAPKLGYIGEIKKLRIEALPAVGSTLQTTLRILGEAAGITLLEAETHVDDAVVASGQMKIFIKED